MKKKRLDELLIMGGFVEDRRGAFIIVTEGRVFIDGQKAVSPAQMVNVKSSLDVRGGRKYVGRAAYKLDAAINGFHIQVAGAVCADIGAATGGFTEVLLERGAKKVYAIDTAKGKLDLKIREHPRVVVMEGTNVLFLDSLPELVDLVTIDVSLTSLRAVLPVLKKFLRAKGAVIALFKPQYEVSKKELRHGIVKDDVARSMAFEDFLQWVAEERWSVLGTMISPIQGSEGNTEYLVHLRG